MHIFVGNLEFSATEQDVRQLFERYGVVDTVRIMTDRETGRPRGFGFVEMPDDTAARAAITGLQGAALGGRTLNVNEARPREERPRPRRERWVTAREARHGTLDGWDALARQSLARSSPGLNLRAGGQFGLSDETGRTECP